MSVTTERLTVEEYLARDFPPKTQLIHGEVVMNAVIVNRRSTPGAPEFDVLIELGRGASLTSPLLPAFDLDLDELFDR